MSEKRLICYKSTSRASGMVTVLGDNFVCVGAERLRPSPGSDQQPVWVPFSDDDTETPQVDNQSLNEVDKELKGASEIVKDIVESSSGMQITVDASVDKLQLVLVTVQENLPNFVYQSCLVACPTLFV